MSLVARMLPPGVAGAEIRDHGQEVPLHPQEMALVATAGEARRRDFALGRACARAALGLSDAPIGPDPAGRPVWPLGFTGSITHARGYAAAVAARKHDFPLLGVDAERIGGVTASLAPRLFTPAERQWLAGLDAAAWPRMATILFSAKEASFKAWGDRKSLVFQDVHIEAQGETLRAVRADGALAGRFAVQDDLVVTAFWQPG